MPYDLLIKNGTVVDGTGALRRQADVAVSGGRIAAIGRIKDGAARTIDASDLVVAPGFVDPHTHYDAQICWDPLVTCSSWHGVTSVVMGNCGVGIAPCKPEVHDVATWDLVNVEGIPYEVLSKGITWEWQSFPEFMAAAERRRTGINVGFLAPMTPFRHFVMGEESLERAARGDEIAAIAALLREAIATGAVGFSTTTFTQHIGFKGRPLACRQASREELKAYANVLRDLGKGAIEISLTQVIGVLSEQEYALLDLLLTESTRPVTWLTVVVRDDKGTHRETLRKAAPLIARRGLPQIACVPAILELDLRGPQIFANMPIWASAFNQPVEMQKKHYSEPAFRQAFREELAHPQLMAIHFERVEVMHAESPRLKALEGRSVADIAAERKKDPVDTFLDLAIEDNLDTRYAIMPGNDSRMGELLGDPRTLIGLSDGGAHVDSHCEAGYATYLLGTWVRERQTLTLEHAVKRITSEPAEFFGLWDRGKLAEGLAADITIFDPNTIGCAKRQEMRADLPGGGRRLVMPAHGVEYTVVNGQVLYEHQQHTGALPGQVLRSRAAPR
ncbi:MAG TPA: amidohydrolase family protein [Candidatus Binataceae bacterium]|nr:amidohydrolase family protein [Candidatus Binataceae bacterium]